MKVKRGSSIWFSVSCDFLIYYGKYFFTQYSALKLINFIFLSRIAVDQVFPLFLHYSCYHEGPCKISHWEIFLNYRSTKTNKNEKVFESAVENAETEKESISKKKSNKRKRDLADELASSNLEEAIDFNVRKKKKHLADE